MSHADLYRSQKASNLMRIDLVLLLYREAESSLRSSIDALLVNDVASFATSHMRTMKLMLGILDGIRPTTGEVARNANRLCLFIIDQISRQTEEGLQNGLNVLVTLKEGFEAIETEARSLEASGAIPPLDLYPAFETIA